MEPLVVGLALLAALLLTIYRKKSRERRLEKLKLRNNKKTYAEILQEHSEKIEALNSNNRRLEDLFKKLISDENQEKKEGS